MSGWRRSRRIGLAIAGVACALPVVLATGAVAGAVLPLAGTLERVGLAIVAAALIWPSWAGGSAGHTTRPAEVRGSAVDSDHGEGPGSRRR